MEYEYIPTSTCVFAKVYKNYKIWSFGGEMPHYD